jgi:hypothetical protein
MSIAGSKVAALKKQDRLEIKCSGIKFLNGNKMKSLFLCFVLSILFIFNVDAASYSKGYVVDNKNDTIYGLLKLGNNTSNAQKCILKDSINQAEHVYTPVDINSYRFSNGKYYVSRSITIDEVTKKVFLEYLVKGIVDIYFYSDELAGYYFVDKGDGILVELKNTKYTVQEDDKTYQRNKNEYIKILGQIFQDSPRTCEELMRSELDYKSLTKLVVDYHTDMCTSEKCVVYEKKLSSEKLRFGLLFGLNSVSLTKGRVDDVSFFRNLQLSSVVYPSVGCFAEVKLPYINNDLLFAQYEASFWQEIHKGTTSYLTDNSLVTNDIKDSKFNFKNSLLLKYDLSREKLRPFLLVGFFAQFALSSKFERTQSIQYYNSSNKYIENSNDSSPFFNIEVGPVGGLGLKYKIAEKRELFIDLRYNWGTGVISDNHFKSNLFSLNLGLQLF